MTIDKVIAEIDDWNGKEVAVESIEGGLTNLNYRLTVEGERYCVRVPGADSDLLAIDRRAEYANTIAAATTGVGAPVAYAVGDIPVMVLGWIEGVTQTDELLRTTPDSVDKIAAAVSRLHAGPAFVSDFDMFRIQPRYRAICQARDFRIPDTYDEYQPLLARIEAAMAVQGHDLVPCNNDLLAANYIDDGTRFWIVDYEYSGMNDPCFELGNTCAESKLSQDQLERLVELTFGAPLRNRVARANLWAAVANYGWTLWACIQREVSDIDFDFWAWGVDDKYARAVAAFEGPEIGGWLDDVTRSD
jgi:thiamine kinase-like enzyme